MSELAVPEERTPARTPTAKAVPPPVHPVKDRWAIRAAVLGMVSLLLVALVMLAPGLRAWLPLIGAGLGLVQVVMVVIGVRTNRRRELIALLTTQLQVKMLFPLRIVQVRWHSLWAAAPAKMTVRYPLYVRHSIEPDLLAAQLSTACSDLIRLRYVPRRHTGRGHLTLVRRPAEVREPSELDEIRQRIRDVVRQLLGKDATVTGVTSDPGGTEVTAFTVRHSAGVKLANQLFQVKITRIMSAMLPGKWRAHFDLETDEARFRLRPPLPKFIPRPVLPCEPGTSAYFELPQAVDEDGIMQAWDNSGVQAHIHKSGRTRTGKALAIDTPIPTPYGWTAMGDLGVGDLLFDEHGKPTRVLGVYDQPPDRPCYEIRFSDHSTIVADRDHLWVTWDNNTRKSYDHANPGGSPYPVDWAAWSPGRSSPAPYLPGDRTRMRQLRAEGLTATQIGRLLGRTACAISQQWDRPEPEPKTVRARTTLELAETLRVGLNRNHGLPATNPLELPTLPLPIEPYVLGYLLGDGDTARAARVACHPDDRAWVRIEFQRVGYATRNQADAGHFSVQGLSRIWHNLGLHEGKHVPAEYLRASTPQRIALVQGLVDSDGGIDHHGCYRFTTTSEALADGFFELVTSLGCVPQKYLRHRTRRGRQNQPSWELVVPTELRLARMPRKAEAARKHWRREQRTRYIVDVRPVASVPVRCIVVDSPNHLFLAGRGMIPTHNTVSLIGDAVEAARRGFRVVVVDPKRVEFLGLRGWPNVEIVATTVQDQIAVIHDTLQLMQERYRLIEEEGAHEVDFERVLLIIDEYRQFYANVKGWWTSIKVTGMPTECPVFEWIGSLLRMAGACGIHVDLGTQRPDAAFLQGETRDNFSARMSTGRLSPDGAQMMYDTQHIGTTIPLNVRGRATMIGTDDVPREVQVYYTPDPRRATSAEDLKLLEDLKPGCVTHPRRAVLLGDADAARADLAGAAEGSGSKPKKTQPTSDEWLEVLNAQLVPWTAPRTKVEVSEHEAATDPVANKPEEDCDLDYEPVEAVRARRVAPNMLLLLEPGRWVLVTAVDATDDEALDLQLIAWCDDDDNEGVQEVGSFELVEVRRPRK